MNPMKIIKTVSALLLFIHLHACSDFLEVYPVGRTVTPVAFSDMPGIRGARAGVYYKMFGLYSSSFYVYADLAGNTIDLDIQSVTQSDIKNIYDYTMPTTSSGYWGTIYDILANINNIIEYQPSLLKEFPGSKDELERIKAEALFLRALCHFDLCRLYAQPYNNSIDASHAGIPIVTTSLEPQSKPSRSSVKQVFAQIIADLNEAETLFGNKDEGTKYYAGKTAVYALLSRVYLYMEDWGNTITYADYVLDKVQLAAGTDYISMFTALSNNETEVIFRFNGTQNTSKTLMTVFNISGEGESLIVPPAVMDDVYLHLFDNDQDDIRFTQLIKKEVSDKGITYYASQKFNVTDNTNPEYIYFNPIVLRASEIYLNRAEAYLNNNDPAKAAEDVKAIIARAHEKQPDAIALEYADIPALRKIIETERMKELSLEGHLLFDLNRWKKDMVRSEETSSSIQRLDHPNDLFVLPIPQRELDINPNITGNPTVND